MLCPSLISKKKKEGKTLMGVIAKDCNIGGSGWMGSMLLGDLSPHSNLLTVHHRWRVCSVRMWKQNLSSTIGPSPNVKLWIHNVDGWERGTILSALQRCPPPKCIYMFSVESVIPLSSGASLWHHFAYLATCCALTGPNCLSDPPPPPPDFTASTWMLRLWHIAWWPTTHWEETIMVKFADSHRSHSRVWRWQPHWPTVCIEML